MDKFVIHGGRSLHGTVSVDGAKNAALPIMAAAIAVQGKSLLHRVPELVDIDTMTLLLQSLGASVTRREKSVTVDSTGVADRRAAYEIVRRMRAGICVLGPLLARFGHAVVSLPGGCNIGHRPIDLHLKGLSALGADLKIESGYVVANCRKLQGSDINLGGPAGSSVTATCNVMSAACLANGTTVIRSAAQEPEVVDLGRYLTSAGARIDGLGTSTIEVTGVEELSETEHAIIPDRIETATLAIAAAATRSRITIEGCQPDHLQSVIETLRQIGVMIREDTASLRIDATQSLHPTDIVAQPHPGIPTDAQAQFTALLATIPGRSVVSDEVFPERFLHVAELMRMGTDLKRVEASTIISGGRPLTGAHVMASDLRASAALVIAGLAAGGETHLHRIYHLDRGYSALEEKLEWLGASVERVRDDSTPTTMPSPHFVDANLKRADS